MIDENEACCGVRVARYVLRLEGRGFKGIDYFLLNLQFAILKFFPLVVKFKSSSSAVDSVGLTEWRQIITISVALTVTV